MTHNSVWQAIEDLAADRNMSCSGLARCSGLDPTIFNKSKRWTRTGKPRWPSTQSLAKVLECADADIEEFARYVTRAEKSHAQQNRA